MSLNLKQGKYFGQIVNERETKFFKLTLSSYEPEYIIEEHSHETDYFCILLRGLYLEEHTGTDTAINPGEILYRPGYYQHKNKFNKEGGVCFNIEMKTLLNQQLKHENLLPLNYIKYNCGSLPSFYKLLSCFQGYYTDDLMLELITDLMSNLKSKDKTRKSLPWVDKIVKIIEERNDSFLSLNELAEQVYVHPVHLSRTFKAQTGITISEYQLKSRISKAMQLLFDNHFSISDISQMSGFYDDSHFIRAFKFIYQISPHQFRISVNKLI